MPKAKFLQSGLTDTWGRKNRKLSDKECGACKKIFRPKCSTSRFCSRKCAWSQNGGHNKKNESWWINSKGYIEGRILLPNMVQIRVKKHRFVMEGIIGRHLESWEDVHHIDGNKQNNNPDNLEIIEHGKHTAEHNKKRKYKKGYKLRLTDMERRARSLRAIAQQLNKIGQAAKARSES